MSFRLVFFLLIIHSFVFGQNETDLYRFSRTTYNGSARFEAMGGSFGALGADLSSAQINPAGYGRFSSSQAGISFYGGSNRTNSTFNGNETDASQIIGGISNFAVVLTEDVSHASTGTLYKQFGFGMNRIETYRNKIHYTGQQYASLLDGFTSQAYGYEPTLLNDYFPFSTFMAYETYAINYDGSNMSYYSLLNSGDVIHDRTVETKGGQTEMFFSYSVNYINKLYAGVNVGVRYYNYVENTIHDEVLSDTTGTPLRSFQYTYNLATKGWGGNLKIGAIYLFSDWFRVGLALHTPTWTELTDQWSAGMATNFADSSHVLNPSLVPTGDYKYKIRNPFKTVASIAYVFGTKGCINLDVEFLDYRMAHFRSTNDANYSPYDYDIENTYAKSVFKPAFNARLGGEFIVMSMLYLRGGIAYYGKAFKDNLDVENRDDLFLSTGFGLKTKKIQLDLGYKFRTGSKNYYAFSGSKTSVDMFTHQITASLGLFF